MQSHIDTLFDLGCLETPLRPRLVERRAESDGNLHEVFEIDGELIEVDSWSAEWEIEEATVPEIPALRQ